MLDVKITTTSGKIHLVSPDELGLVDKLVRNVEQQNNRGSEVAGEEGLDQFSSGHIGVANGGESNPELSDQHQTVEDEANPGADHTGLGLEGQLVQAVALGLPATAETNMREADGAPGEDGRKTRDGHHPAKSNGLLVRSSQEAEETQSRGHKDGPEGTTLAINVGQETGCLALLGESGQGTGRSVDGGVTDGQDSNHDHYVHDGGQALDTGVLDGDDKGRCLGVGGGATRQESLFVVGNQETDDGKRDDVEESDPPEHLLDSTGERLARVSSLGRGETDQLGTRERKSGVDKDTAETLEAIVECAWVAPVLPTNITTLRTTTAVQNDSEDARGGGGGGLVIVTNIEEPPIRVRMHIHEANDGNDLDEREDKLGFTISLHAEHVDGDDHHPKDSDPGGIRHARVPVIDGDRGGDNFER